MERVEVEKLLLKILFGNSPGISDLEHFLVSGETNLAQIIENAEDELSSEQIEAVDKVYNTLIRGEKTPVVITTNPVRSSNIDKIGYSYEDKILAVEFKGGSKYIYPEVENEEYNNLMLSESLGSAFSEFKKSHTDFKKLN